MKPNDYKNAAALLDEVTQLLMRLGHPSFKNINPYNDTFSPASRKLVGKIFLEWSKDLKKSSKPSDLRLSELLLGFFKYLK